MTLCNEDLLSPEAAWPSPVTRALFYCFMLVMARFWVCSAGAGFFLACVVLHEHFCGSGVSRLVRKSLSGIDGTIELKLCDLTVLDGGLGSFPHLHFQIPGLEAEPLTSRLVS